MSTDQPSWPTDDQGNEGAAPPPPPPPPAPAAPIPPAPGVGAAPVAASLGVRFGARLIDALITGAIGFVIGFALPGESLLLTGLIGAVIGLGYYVAFETSNGATPGKKLLKLEVVGASGGNPTVEESVKRNIWLAFQAVPIIGGVAGLVAVIAIAVTIQTSDDNRGVHDTFASTLVRQT